MHKKHETILFLFIYVIAVIGKRRRLITLSAINLSSQSSSRAKNVKRTVKYRRQINQKTCRTLDDSISNSINGKWISFPRFQRAVFFLPKCPLIISIITAANFPAVIRTQSRKDLSFFWLEMKEIRSIYRSRRQFPLTQEKQFQAEKTARKEFLISSN